MVDIELKVTDEAKAMRIKVTSDNSLLNKIYIIAHDKWDGTENYASLAEKTIDISAQNIKTYTTELDTTALTGLAAKMYFVVVSTKDGVNWIETTFYKHPMYLNFMRLARQITEQCCEPPMEFVDLLLRKKTLEYALKSKHYIEATKIYDQFFMVKQPTGETKRGCACHG